MHNHREEFSHKVALGIHTTNTRNETRHGHQPASSWYKHLQPLGVPRTSSSFIYGSSTNFSWNLTWLVILAPAPSWRNLLSRMESTFGTLPRLMLLIAATCFLQFPHSYKLLLPTKTWPPNHDHEVNY